MRVLNTSVTTTHFITVRKPVNTQLKMHTDPIADTLDLLILLAIIYFNTRKK